MFPSCKQQKLTHYWKDVRGSRIIGDKCMGVRRGHGRYSQPGIGQHSKGNKSRLGPCRRSDASQPHLPTPLILNYQNPSSKS